MTVHDLTFFDHPEWHERTKVAWFRAAIRYAARHAAGIVCVSETTARRLGELFAPRCPVAVVPHGVDTSRFAPDEPHPGHDDEVLERLGLVRPYVLHVGTLEPRKGIGDLVEAFDLLAGERPAIELVLAGGAGWGGAPVLRSMAASPFGGRIRRLGYVPDADLPALVRRSLAVVYPSVEEGFGLPALEALACGVPLVTTSGTAMAELAGDAALLVAPQDHEALASAISSVLAQQGSEAGGRRRALGLAIAARHGWDACAEAHLAAYRRAAR